MSEEEFYNAEITFNGRIGNSDAEVFGFPVIYIKLHRLSTIPLLPPNLLIELLPAIRLHLMQFQIKFITGYKNL